MAGNGSDKLRMFGQGDLLEDGSVAWSGYDRRVLEKEAKEDQPFTALRHQEVRYEVTDHCNAICIMCPREQHEDARPHGIMDLGKYKRSIDEVVSLGAKKIVLTGFGEPLIDKTLEQKISYAKAKNLNTYIITNGSLITPARAKSLIESGLDEMRVSFYGMSPETYNVVMERLDFHVATNNLLGFLEERSQRGLKKPKLELSYLVMKENESDVDAFRAYWEPRADAIEMWKPHNFGDGRSYRERHQAVELKATCGRPENGPLQIQWDGEVIPCCYDYNNQIVLGNAFEQPVLDILNGEKYRFLRWAHRTNNFRLFPYCDQCDQLLPHADALVYTNRHNLPPEVAVRLSNTDLYDLVGDKEIDPENINAKYKQGLIGEGA
ncbi:MAG: radical SAM/SPASM domain-containing protein [Nitrospira sp.]|nr:radical SAM/SPASM domain-containing protein [Nitrospira sp.]